MASIGREGERGELKRIIFRDAAGNQQSLRPGKCSEKAAQNSAHHAAHFTAQHGEAPERMGTLDAEETRCLSASTHADALFHALPAKTGKWAILDSNQ
jgi:hypothetical protein